MRSLFLFLIVLTGANSSFAQSCIHWAAKLESLEGSASVKRNDTAQWQATVSGDTYCYGDTLKINEFRAALRLENDTLVRLSEGSTIRFMPPQKSFWVELITGAAHFISRTPKDFTIKAPYVNAAVEGTEFMVSHNGIEDTVSVYEGAVLVSNDYGSTRLHALQQSITAQGAAPSTAVTIRLLDSADWTLHYPPFFIDEASLPEQVDRSTPARILETLDEHGNAESLPALNLKTAVALAFGRIDLAKSSNMKALTIDAANSDAQALNTLIKLIDGEKDAALARSRSLIQEHSNNANVWLVHSFTLQAAFLMEEAQQASKQALTLAPQNPLAIIRNAELAISLNQNTKAKKLLRQSSINHPFYQPYGDALLALIALQNNNNRKANTLLEASVKKNPSIPQTRFLLGLSEIRLQRLKQGRENIEMAVALAPQNSLYRSYLGKAYASERRGDKAAEQFELAKILDPDDPTPWFYSALEKQSNNDFVGAIQSYEISRELNDGRAVYRSRLLLDEDNAARGASQGLTYSTIGFADQAVLAGATSVQQAPSDYAGHRLLAEAYGKARYYETLTASERLQATLHQPLGVKPLPLGLSETGLQVVEGTSPADLGINEYSPLFVQEGIDASLTMLSGSHDTVAYDASASLLHENVAFNLGHYHYTSDGFRENNDAQYDISNALLHWQPTDSTNLQFEASHREDEHGDLGLYFDPLNYSDSYRQTNESTTYRLSGSHALNASNKILVSVAKRDSEVVIKQVYASPLGDFSDFDNSESDINNAELQYFLTGRAGNLLLGYSNIDTHVDTFTYLSLYEPGSIDPSYLNRKFDSWYIYYNSPIIKDRLIIHAGVEYQDSDFETNAGLLGPSEDILTSTLSNKAYPKLGITYKYNKYLSFRAARFETAAKEILLEPSLMPTHFAGFTQLFDFEPSITSDNRAFAVDLTNYNKLSGGLSYTDQLIDQDLQLINDFIDREIDHKKASGYLTYLLADSTSISVSLTRDNIERPILADWNDLAIPVRIDTKESRLQIDHRFKPWLTGQLQIDRVSQDYVTEPVPLGGIRSYAYDETFYTINSSVKIKLPNNYGLVKIEAKNLENKEYYFADFNIFTATPKVQSSVPERSLYMILQLSIP